MIQNKKQKQDIVIKVRQLLILKSQIQKKNNIEYLVEQNNKPLRSSLIRMYQHLRSVLDECRNKKLIVNFYQ